MSVTSCYVRGLADDQNLDRFLETCQKQCLTTQESLIISVTRSLPLVDPLAVLQRFALPRQRTFYWENQPENTAIAAWDSCLEKTIQNSSDRFQEIKNFLRQHQDNIREIGETNFPEVGLKLLASFSFFPTSSVNSPFPCAMIFIPQWQVTRTQEFCFITYNCHLSSQTNPIHIKAEIKQKVNQIKEIAQLLVRFSFPLFSHPSHQLQSVNNQQRDQFKATVKRALNDIGEKKLSKIVLSHHLDIVSPFEFNPFLSLHNLRQKYPACYIFSIGNNEGMSFIGATPERLFSLRKQKLVSDALAGSAPRGKSAIADRKLAKTLLNSEKEKREHQAVSDYLIKQLQALNLTPQRSRRQLLKLNNIQHLWTLIQADIPSNLNPLDIVEKLHPTPAVAGVPTEIACEKIRDYERFDRGFYAAPLGWLDLQGNAEFMVGIRSAMINQKQARLYAGAGIVAGSQPEKELAEVQFKLQAMLKALR